MHPIRPTSAADPQDKQREVPGSNDQGNNHYPRGIPYLIANEAAERFSFFGMKAVLLVFMTTYMVSPTGAPSVMPETQAKAWFHIFLTAVYLAPICGALIADLLLGKYLTILVLSIVYCMGHATLAIDHTKTGLAIGLLMIAMGAGGIKPCVSANLGDQIPKNSPLTSKIFSWFYLSINIGALISMLITPVLLQKTGPSAAFGLPGILMLVATAAFLAGTNKFVIKPPDAPQIRKDISSPQVRTNIASLVAIYALTAVFWSLFDQMGSTLLIQASHMNRQIGSLTILPAQVQAANPILIILLVPLLTYIAYPLISKRASLTQITKITSGMALAAIAFASACLVQRQIDAGSAPNILWQTPVYLLLTTAEIMISVTCLELSYTKAPQSMKSIIMALFMLSIATGNLITAAINLLIPYIAQGNQEPSHTSLYLFFTALMATATIAFKFLSPRLITRK